MKIAFAVAEVLGCLLVSLMVTWLVWQVQVGGRAFRCTDAGPFTLSLAYWTSADTHQTAGDEIKAGWTWEQVTMLNGFYKFALFALWIGGSMVLIRRIYEPVEKIA